jgi:hypothetical protein
MITMLPLLVFFTGSFPIVQAARANRHTTLFHAIIWTIGAWLGWISSACLNDSPPLPNNTFFPYLALALTGCASMAVLGAWRPGVGAWNFVILGLLTVMGFLWFEGRLAEDDWVLRRVRTVFLASTVAIGVLNYLPTRLAPAAILLAIGCSQEILSLSGSEWLIPRTEAFRLMGRVIVGLVPWIAYLQMRWQPRARSDFDEVWLRFRNSYGMFWSQRLREQFNLSAKNSDWPVILRWQGLRVSPGAPPLSPSDRQAMFDNLRALMKRFEGPGKEIKTAKDAEGRRED